MKLTVKQNALLAVQLHHLGIGNQVGSLSTGQEVQWLGGVLDELGRRRLDNLSAVDECGRCQT